MDKLADTLFQNELDVKASTELKQSELEARLVRDEKSNLVLFAGIQDRLTRDEVLNAKTFGVFRNAINDSRITEKGLKASFLAMEATYQHMFSDIGQVMKKQRTEIDTLHGQVASLMETVKELKVRNRGSKRKLTYSSGSETGVDSVLNEATPPCSPTSPLSSSFMSSSPFSSPASADSVLSSS